MQKLVIAAGLAFTACHNPNYCPGNPDNNCNETPVDAKPDTMEALDCVAMGCEGGQVCDTATRACVACTDSNPGTCAGTSPVCHQETCHACIANAECASSDACMPDGSCAATADVAYVKANGGADNATCDQAHPCATLAAGFAAKNIVRASGDFTAAISVPSGTRTLLGDRNGATVGTTIAAMPTLLNVAAGATMSVRDVGFNNATSVAIQNAGTLTLDRCEIKTAQDIGLRSTAGTVTVTRSKVTGNSLGGVKLDSTTFHIENTVIAENPGPFGGMFVSFGNGTIDFTTIANNIDANDGNSRGINCASTAVTLNSVLLQGNTGPQQSGSGCSYTYSSFFPDAVGTIPAGTGNVRLQTQFSGAHDFHLASGSPLKDQADPTATLPDDIDGNSRPQGNVRDIGADELMP
jgi:hypothetical protein